MLNRLETLLAEARYSLRGLLRRPVFASASILSLAVGIGANTALFSVVNRLLIEPLPYPGAERLFAVEETRGQERSNGNPARLRDYAARVEAAESISGFYADGLAVRGPDGARRIDSIRFAGPFLETLGVAPDRGRGFTGAEIRGEGEPVAVITHGLWRGWFNGRDDVIGSKLSTRNATFTIVGVMPEAFVPPVQGATLIAPAPRDLLGDNRKAAFLSLFARLKPGETPARLEQQLAAVLAALSREHPETDRDLRARAVPGKEALAGEYRLPVLLLMTVVAFVLLIACVNLAGVMLARTLERQRESSIRAAVGAGRAALLRLFLWEAFWIATAGGLAATGVAVLGIDLLVYLAPEGAANLTGLALDRRALGFTAGVSLLCALLIGIVPAWQASAASLTGAMRVSRGRMLLRPALVVAQTALSLLLVSGTFVLARTLIESRRMPLGFSPARLWTIEVNLPWDTPEAQLRDFERRALEALGSLPGVRSVAVTDRIPLAGATQTRSDPKIEGVTLPPALSGQSFGIRAVSTGYAATLGVPVLSGRMFDNSGRQCVVNGEFARRYFGGADPAGRRVSLGGSRWFEIVGVIGSVRAEPMQAPPAEIYVNSASTYWPMLDFVLKSENPAMPDAARALRSLVPDLVPGPVMPVEAAIDRVYGQPLLLVRLMAGFTAAALLLALAGLYGVLASNVTARARDFGIRMALGAESWQIQWLALRQGLVISGSGSAIGLTLSAATAVAVSRYLPGLPTADSLSLGAAALLLMAGATAACWVPARRAARIDPAVVLRRE